MELARMVMKPTRATPIIRADAVAAVRRGLRRAFSVAPGGRSRRTPWSGAPSTVHDGTGDHRGRDEHAEDEEQHAEAEELERSGTRAGDAGGEGDGAATGDGEAEQGPLQRSVGVLDGGVPQRGDGLDAAGLEGRTDRREQRHGDADHEGRDDRAGRDDHVAARDLEADRSEERPQAEGHAHAGRRGRRPRRPAPTMADSSSTDRSTWRRLAPTARSIAISRMRWATMIEKVL